MDANSSKHLFFSNIYILLLFLRINLFFFILLEVIERYFHTSLESLMTPHCEVSFDNHRNFNENCIACRKKKQFHKRYLMSRRSEWCEYVWGKFNLDKSTNLVFIKYDLVKYSICDFEYLFRKIFQRTYELQCDRGHQIWNNNLLYGSVIRLEGTIRQYWEGILLKITQSRNYDIRP